MTRPRRQSAVRVPSARWNLENDRDKDKAGCEINFSRHFCSYSPPRPLAEIDAGLKREEKLVRLLREVAG